MIFETSNHKNINRRKDQRSRYPDAKVAWLKDGGDFPFLSRPDEINMHVEVHIYSIVIFKMTRRTQIWTDLGPQKPTNMDPKLTKNR